MDFFKRTPQQTVITVPAEWRFPVLPELTELPPFKINDRVWETAPNGKRYACTVANVIYDYTVYNPVAHRDGDWCIQVGYFANNESTEICYTWTSARALEVAK